MRIDHFAYQRATKVAGFGLMLQAAIGVLLLTFGLAAHDTFPGQVRAEEGRLHVACGDDRYVELLALQPEGGPEVDAAGFLAARAHV